MIATQWTHRMRNSPRLFMNRQQLCLTEYHQNGSKENCSFCIMKLKCSRSFFITKNKSDIFYFAPPPSPQFLYDRRLQNISCYIARYYVRKKYVRLGILKNLYLLSLREGGGAKQNRSVTCYITTFNS